MDVNKCAESGAYRNTSVYNSFVFCMVSSSVHIHEVCISPARIASAEYAGSIHARSKIMGSVQVTGCYCR